MLHEIDCETSDLVVAKLSYYIMTNKTADSALFLEEFELGRWPFFFDLWP